MKFLSLLVAVLSVGSMALADTRTPAFPGAEGYGRYATGGREGSVYYVTTLEDTNEKGSLRYGVTKMNDCIILFKVSGTIHLNSQLSIRCKNVTIAGQSAPGSITLADYPVSVHGDCENLIIRFLRFRMGDRKLSADEADGADAFGGRFFKNVIIDHCSVSWSTDECCSFYACYDFTLQWCLVSESLRVSKHSKGSHGYGAIWGGIHASFLHNMLAHHDSRTPRFGTGTIEGVPPDMHECDMRNCVIYNWAGNGCYGAEGMHINMVGNYYKPGPTTTTGSKNRWIGVDDATADDGSSVWGKYYVAGNYNPVYTTYNNNQWGGVVVNTDASKVNGVVSKSDVKSDTVMGCSPLFYLYTAQDAYTKVLDYVGCSLRRDSIDLRIIQEARNGTATFSGSTTKRPGIIDTVEDLKPAGAGSNWSPWPELSAGAYRKDRDDDGIPDMYESMMGLDSRDETDAMMLNAEGYTYLEQYLNEILLGDITTGQYAGAAIVDHENGINVEESTTDIIQVVRDGSACASGQDCDLLGRPVSDKARGFFIHDGKLIMRR